MLPQDRNYNIIEEIGSGGFAKVYAASLHVSSAEFAIKVIDLDYLASHDIPLNVRDEIAINKHLNHPHIVPVLDAWIEQETAYMVMPLLDGGNLAHRLLRRGAFSVLEANQLLQQIASALHYVHNQHIIHQDIKPENIIFDHYGNAYLADFGIAQNALMPQHPKQAKHLFGSPRYVSPEQLRRKPTSYQSDIYSLGLLMYQVLTGAEPYEAASIQELFKQQLFNSLPSLESKASYLPHELNEAISRATKKDPSDRYTTVRDFAEDFSQIATQYLYSLVG
jgi:eukaryotic-like serine/threonine-protein kinase